MISIQNREPKFERNKKKMELEISALKNSFRTHRNEIIKLFENESFSHESAAEQIRYSNSQFLEKSILTLMNKISENELYELLKQISEEISKEIEISDLFVRFRRENASSLTYNIDDYLFSTSKSSNISDFRENLPAIRGIVKSLQELQNSSYNSLLSLLSVAAILKLKSYNDRWQPYITELIVKALGTNLTSEIDFSTNSKVCSESIINYLFEKDASNKHSNLLIIARGEGLEEKVRKRHQENGIWNWEEDINFLRFNVFTQFWGIRSELNDEIYKERIKVIENLKDLLPVKF